MSADFPKLGSFFHRSPKPDDTDKFLSVGFRKLSIVGVLERLCRAEGLDAFGQLVERATVEMRDYLR